MSRAAPGQGAAVLAPYYPTSTRLVLSRDEKSEAETNTVAALPATTWTSCVPYLRNFDVSAMTVIYQPPSVVQLRHAGAVFVDSIAEIYGKLPRITLVEEVGPYAVHHRDNNGDDGVAEFGLLRAPPAIDWYSRTKDAVQRHPRLTAEEEEYEKEFYRRIEAQREKAKKSKEQRKRLRRQSANKYSLHRASVSSAAGTSAVLAAATTAAMANTASATDDSLGSPSYRSERAGLSLPNSPFDVEGTGGGAGVGGSAAAGRTTTTTMTATNVTGSRPSLEGNASDGPANVTPVTVTSNPNAQRTAKGLLRRARYNAHRTASPSLLLRQQQQLALPAGPYYQNLISPLSVLSARGGSVCGDGPGAGGFRFPALSSTTSEVSQMTDFNASVAGSSGGTPTMASEGVVVGGTKTASTTPVAATVAGVVGGSGGVGAGYMSSSSQLLASSSTAGLPLPITTPPSRLVYATQLPCTVSRVPPAPVPAGHVSPSVVLTTPASATRESLTWTHTVASSNAGRVEQPQQLRPMAHIVASATAATSQEEPSSAALNHRPVPPPPPPPPPSSSSSGVALLPPTTAPLAVARLAPQHVTHQISAQVTPLRKERKDAARQGSALATRVEERKVAYPPLAASRVKTQAPPSALPQEPTGGGSTQATPPRPLGLVHKPTPVATLPTVEDKEGSSYQRSSTSSSSMMMTRGAFRPVRQPGTARPGEHVARPQRTASDGHTTTAPSPLKDSDVALPPRKGAPPQRVTKAATTTNTVGSSQTVVQPHTCATAEPPPRSVRVAQPAPHTDASVTLSESSADATTTAVARVPSRSMSGMTDPPRRLVTEPPLQQGGSVSHAETMASLPSPTHRPTPQHVDAVAACGLGDTHRNGDAPLVQSPARSINGSGAAAAAADKTNTTQPLPPPQQQQWTSGAFVDGSSLSTALPSMDTDPTHGPQRWLSESRNDSCSPILMPLSQPVVELVEPVRSSAPAPSSGPMQLPPSTNTVVQDTTNGHGTQTTVVPAASTMGQQQTQPMQLAAVGITSTAIVATNAQAVARPAPFTTHVPGVTTTAAASAVPLNGTVTKAMSAPMSLPSTAVHSVTSMPSVETKEGVVMRPAVMSTRPMTAPQYVMTEADATAKLNGAPAAAAATPVMQHHGDKATAKCCVVM